MGWGVTASFLPPGITACHVDSTVVGASVHSQLHSHTDTRRTMWETNSSLRGVYVSNNEI